MIRVIFGRLTPTMFLIGFRITLFFSCAFALVGTLSAQTDAPLTSQYAPGAIPSGASMPINIYPAVTGRPFRAEVNARRIETKPDGKQITYEFHGILARDSEGRVLQETLPSPQVPIAGGAAFMTHTVKVTDPDARVELRWDDLTRTVIKAPPLPQQLTARPQPLDRCENDQGAVRSYPNGRTQRAEALGERTIQGTLTRGCRIYTFIPAAAGSNDQPTTVTDDSWTSPELRVALLRIHHDPGREDETVRLDKINRVEPDHRIFQPPPDYQVHDPEQEELQREQAQPPITHPELLAGPWETTNPASGAIDGFNISLLTKLRDAAEYLSTIEIRVYHRQGQNEVGGSFTINGDSNNTWDGKRLRLQFTPRTPDAAALDLDLTFDQTRQQWTGTFNRNGFARQVILKRPRARSNPLVGDWYLHTDRSRRLPAGTFYETLCLHIAQRNDGSLVAWEDRRNGPAMNPYGQKLKVLSAENNSIRVQTDNAGGNTVGFTGSLSADGTSIEGHASTNGTQNPRTMILIKSSGEGFSPPMSDKL
jgi:hypothetical protein